MINQVKNMLIGLFVVVACFLIVGIILFIKPGVGNGRQVIRVHFTDINGINIGTRVLLAGRPIGEVYAIEQIPQARESKQNEFGQVYFYLVTLHIDSHVTIFTTDKITIATSGLLGERLIDIVPQSFSKTAKTMVVTADTQIYADSNDFFTSAFNELSSLSNKVEEALDRVVAWINQYGDDVGSAVKSFGRASTEVANVMKSFNDMKIVKQVHDTIGAANDILEGLVEGNFSRHLSVTVANVSDISTSLAQGKGTIGRLIEDDNLYIQVSAAMSKLNHMMDDINNYGILFWYNKTWLRSREERLAAYKQLNDPNAFRHYLSQESQSISASLSRLTELAKQAEATNNQKVITDNPDLWKNLQTLKQQLSTLQTNVDYYMEELNNQVNQ